MPLVAPPFAAQPAPVFQHPEPPPDRSSWPSDAVADLSDILNLDPTDRIVDGLVADIVESNLKTATPLEVPEEFERLVRAYAKAKPWDGKLLLAGIARSPKFYSGGWLLEMQPDAGAMTLDTSVFVSGGALTLDAYVHELVHVGQFAQVGSAAFLREYFGGGLLEVLRRMVEHEAIDIVTTGPQEARAYRVETRFIRWLRRNRAEAAKKFGVD